MRTRKKWRIILVLGLSVLAVIIGMVSEIYAYLSSQDSKWNITTIGDVKVIAEEEYNPEQPIVSGGSIIKKFAIRNTGDGAAGFTRVLVVFSDSKMEDLVSVNYNTADWEQGSDGYWYYKKPLAKGELTTDLFTTLTFSAEMTEEQIQDFDVYIYAEAVQQGNYKADEYYDAFEEVLTRI